MRLKGKKVGVLIESDFYEKEIFYYEHRFPEEGVELHFLSCTLLNAPVARLGQEMRWVAREELSALEFPPADEELIERLIAQGQE